MKLLTCGFMLVLASVLISTSLFAIEAPGDAKAKKTNPAYQPKTTVETDFTYIIKGFPEKILHTANGTYVNCRGTSGRCLALDFDAGVAIVDPDDCNMGATYIGCEKVDGDYWVLVKQTPEVAIWLLHELQQTTMKALKTKIAPSSTVIP
jgi:hypothetical protein